jgi:hypothetical protein
MCVEPGANNCCQEQLDALLALAAPFVFLEQVVRMRTYHNAILEDIVVEHRASPAIMKLADIVSNCNYSKWFIQV